MLPMVFEFGFIWFLDVVFNAFSTPNKNRQNIDVDLKSNRRRNFDVARALKNVRIFRRRIDLENARWVSNILTTRVRNILRTCSIKRLGFFVVINKLLDLISTVNYEVFCPNMK